MFFFVMITCDFFPREIKLVELYPQENIRPGKLPSDGNLLLLSHPVTMEFSLDEVTTLFIECWYKNVLLSQCAQSVSKMVSDILDHPVLSPAWQDCFAFNSVWKSSSNSCRTILENSVPYYLEGKIFPFILMYAFIFW